MMSAGSFATRFTKIDDLTRPDHSYLTSNDECYFLGEYTARAGYTHGPTNDLISNFKKTMDRQGRSEWRYKGRAIREASKAFLNGLGGSDSKYLNLWTFVPMPPSKAKGDPLYDDRLLKMLAAMRGNPPLDIRELVIQSESTESAHELNVRPHPTDIEARYRIDDNLTEPNPSTIAVIDDVLTTGAHYRAAHSVLSARFPDAEIKGLFIARRVIPPIEFDAPDDF